MHVGVFAPGAAFFDGHGRAGEQATADPSAASAATGYDRAPVAGGKAGSFNLAQGEKSRPAFLHRPDRPGKERARRSVPGVRTTSAKAGNPSTGL